MEITYEIMDFLQKLSANSGAVDRNTEQFLYYFGFLEAELPTMQETGRKFGHTRQRVEQLINKELDAIKKVPFRFTALKEFIEILSCYSVIDSQLLTRILVSRGLVAKPEDCNLAGLLNLAEALGYCGKYVICCWNLRKVLRNEYKRNESYCIISADNLELIKEGYAFAKSLSSDLGLVKYSYFKEELQEELREQLGENLLRDHYDYFEALTQIIRKNNENYCLVDEKGELYFHFGGYVKDGFLSSLGHIFDVAKRVRINELAEAMRRPIQRRQGRKANTLLPTPIVEKFISQYPYLHEENGYVTFSGEVQPVENTIELEAVFFLKEHGGVFFRVLLDYLYQNGQGEYGIDNIKAIIFHSPLISVNKAPGRDCLYQLIGSSTDGDIISATPDEILEDMDEDNNPGKRAAKALEEAKLVGEAGEKLVNKYLENCMESHLIRNFAWESKHDPFAPFDFQVENNDGSIIFIDAKSTAKTFETDIFISYAELQKMRESDCYLIFRVYLIMETTARMRVSANMKTIASEVLSYMEQAPYGVLPESVMLSPNRIDFDDEICLSESLL